MLLQLLLQWLLLLVLLPLLVLVFFAALLFFIFLTFLLMLVFFVDAVLQKKKYIYLESTGNIIKAPDVPVILHSKLFFC